jgi:hypothetical protein
VVTSNFGIILVKRIACLALLAALCGCAVTPEKVEREKLEPVTSGERIELVAPVRVIETRGPLALKLEWQLLPGLYVEQHAIPAGRVFASAGRLVQFTSSLGEKFLREGGFVVLKDRPGMARLYSVREPTGGSAGHESMVIALGGGRVGDLLYVADFPLSDLRRR